MRRLYRKISMHIALFRAYRLVCFVNRVDLSRRDYLQFFETMQSAYNENPRFFR
jgi:hypothetical protein